MSDFFEKTRKSLARTKQMALEKMGKTGSTVDQKYIDSKQQFEDFYKKVQTVNADTERYLSLLRDFSIIQAEIARDFEIIYGSKAPTYPVVQMNIQAVNSIDNARKQCDEDVRNNAIIPTSKFLGQFKEVSEKFPIHDTRRVDMDRYTRDLRIHREHANNERSKMTEEKLTFTRTQYENLHDEILCDIEALFNDRSPFFDPVLSTDIQSRANYFRESAQSTAKPLQSIAHIDKTTIHDHPTVITPPNSNNTPPKEK